MFVGGASEPTGLVVRQARELGFKGGFILMDQAKMDEVAKVSGGIKSLEGSVGVVPLDKYENEGAKLFLKKWQEDHNGVATSETAYNYFAMYLIAQAMQEAGTVDDAKALKAAMEEEKDAEERDRVKINLNVLKEWLEKVETLATNAPKFYYSKLAKRLEELKLSTEENEDRLTRELVIFTDKIDITEELTRMKSHVKQFRDIVLSEKTRIGRELDFLIQEMNREVNTIAAKSQELEITQAILYMKSEQEKIREQLQNIE